MKTGKRFLMIFFLGVLLLSMNVVAERFGDETCTGSGENKFCTIFGTKFTTTYYPNQLAKVFNGYAPQEHWSSKLGRTVKTGEILLADSYDIADDARCNALKYTKMGSLAKAQGQAGCSWGQHYGTVAGDILTVKFGKSIEVVVRNNARNKGVYYNHFGVTRQWKAQILKSDKIVIFKMPDKRFKGWRKDYFNELSVDSEGGVYYQGKVVVCDPDNKEKGKTVKCEFKLKPKYKRLTIDGKAVAMSRRTYKKYKRLTTAAQRAKYKPWEVLHMDYVNNVYFYYRPKYEFTSSPRNLVGNLDFKFAFDPEYRELIGSDGKYKGVASTAIGGIKVTGKNGMMFGLTRPIGKKYDAPIYLFRGKLSTLKGLPKKTLYHFDLIQWANQLEIGDNLGFPLLDLASGTMFGMDYGANKQPFATYPDFFKSFNTIKLNSDVLYMKPAKAKIRMRSPLTRKVRNTDATKSDYIIWSHISTNDFSAVTDSSTLVLKGLSIKIKIRKDSIKLPKYWYYLETTFTARFKRGSETDEMVCNHETKTCTLNGRPITKELTRLKGCKREAFGKETINFKCPQPASCRILRKATGSKKINLLFIGNRFENDVQLKNTVNRYLFGVNGLLKTKPFSELKNKNLFQVYYYNLDNEIKPIEKTYSDGSKFKVTKIPGSVWKKCPTYNYAFVLTTESFRDHTLSRVAHLSVPEPYGNNPKTAIHEFGHSFGHLSDEYFSDDKKSSPNILAKNCVPAKSKGEAKIKALREWSSILGSKADAIALVASATSGKGWYGCGGDCKKEICQYYLRQADNGFMRDEFTAKGWGPVSLELLYKKLKSHGGGK